MKSEKRELHVDATHLKPYKLTHLTISGMVNKFSIRR